MKMIVAHPTEGRTYTKKALEDLLQEAEIYGENTSNLIIATTSGSFKKQVGDVVGRKIKWRRVIRDELHLEKTPATKNIKLMLSETAKRRRGPTSMWALSGTPFERSPKDLAGYISVLRTGAENAWEIDGRDELKFGLAAPFQEIDTKYNKLIKDAQKGKTLRKVDIEGVLGKFGKILHALMIRRTMSSSWFGKVLLDVPESEHQDLSFTVSSAYKNDLDWLRECAQHNLQRAAAARQTKASTKFSQPKAQSRASGTEYQKYGRRLRLAATIPAIPGLLRKKEILDDMFLQETILKQGWYDNGPNYNASPYKKYLTQFVQSSEKFTLINQHVLQVLRTPKDPENPEKIIIMSSFPAMAFITALWLKKGKHSVLFIHSALKNRATLVNDFQGVMREDTDEAKRPKTTTKGTKAESERDAARKASILVSTIQLIGTGFTITRATHVVMLEPAWMLRDEKQGYARIRRFSQKNPTFTWKLINNDSFVEPQIMQRHAARGRFVELSFGDNTDQQDFGRNAPQDFDIVDEDKGVAGSKKPAARYTDKQHEDSDEEVDGYSSGEEFEF
ncbi:uncharacterized protein LY89DRAFT_57418 [Mollisia scopiformis]|uniref:Uncharacterized protein n=1 Tax=Mollisia scopiformis TaxID=149040 RepID=A0A194XBM5_MOLSC|nr:uncharacterized protein LY89DRAFT_57418 [Mollisia scopiformis]KUJ17566.1 hypothetical protein LY89DRAFT_57418 [Mollisia scopiformis]